MDITKHVIHYCSSCSLGPEPSNSLDCGCCLAMYSPAAPDNSGPALGSSEPHTKMPINPVIGISVGTFKSVTYCINDLTDFALADIQAACASVGLGFGLDDSPIQSSALTDVLGIRRPISGVRVVSLTVQRVRSLLRQSVVDRLHTVSIRPLRLRCVLPVYEGFWK